MMQLDTILHGDALERLRELPDNSVDAIVTDPPAGISFMGKDWDNFSGKPARDSQPILDAAPRINRQSTSPFPYGGDSRPGKAERDAFIAFMSAVMAEALRVLKPGGHALVWALPRTSHWTALALEDAGFEIRDCVYHLFGSGFPKSLDVSKAIDKMTGAQREVVETRQTKDIRRNVKKDAEIGWTTRQGKFSPGAPSQTMEYQETAPATPDAREWDGWGTALKPAVECWWLCRKPLSEPTVAKNVLKWGTGAINVDGCRVGNETRVNHAAGNKPGGNSYNLSVVGMPQNAKSHATQGRWPANLVMSHTLFCVQRGVQLIKSNSSRGKPSCGQPATRNGVTYGLPNNGQGIHYDDENGNETVELWECAPDCPVAMLDEQSGISKSSDRLVHHNAHKPNAYDNFNNERITGGHNDQGGASRYFQRFLYEPKASRAERNRGCEELPSGQTFDKNTSKQIAHINHATGETTYNEYQPSANNNHHPTVKPLALMRWLIRLITPPGGVVLDCFAGSGSTLVAAKEEGFSFIGIEREQEYFVIITARLKAVS